jgi:NADP-dependent 3-hydroxy acid dehydrogenase YdfG
VALIEPGLTESDMIELSADEKREKIEADLMLRAEDIAVAAHFVLTQPRRAVVQQITMVPRAEGGE